MQGLNKLKKMEFKEILERKIKHYGKTEAAYEFAAEEYSNKLIKETQNESLILYGVSKSVAKKYAEFCVRCDRERLPLLELDDYIKQYCC